MKVASRPYFYRDATSVSHVSGLNDLKAVALWAALGLTLTALFVAQGADIAQLLATAG